MTLSQSNNASINSHDASLTFRELLDYTSGEAERWHVWLSGHPEAIDTPFAEGRTATVRGVIQHIFAVERRYADRLLGDSVTPYKEINAESVDTLFAAGIDARERLSRYIASASTTDLARRLEFQTISAGTQSASARKVVAHTLLHSARTWAQVATVLRQHGLATDWPHDLLFSDAMA
jgi:uncharacterized damage-inducible protein DinB